MILSHANPDFKRRSSDLPAPTRFGWTPRADWAAISKEVNGLIEEGVKMEIRKAEKELFVERRAGGK